MPVLLVDFRGFINYLLASGGWMSLIKIPPLTFNYLLVQIRVKFSTNSAKILNRIYFLLSKQPRILLENLLLNAMMDHVVICI